MVTRKTLVRSCDRCGSTKEVVRRLLAAIESDGTRRGQVTFDACESCRTSVPLSEWDSMIPTRKNGPRRRGRLVVSEETVKRARGRRKAS